MSNYVKNLGGFALASFIALALSAGISIGAPLAEKEHAHPTEGPHGGALAELGEEEYHAELVDDEKTHSVTVYILDSSAKQAVSIQGKEVAINVKRGGKPEQFKLRAAPQKGDKAGLSSRFTAQDEKLCDRLDSHDADIRLRVTIMGKSYTAKIVHDHGHDHKESKK